MTGALGTQERQRRLRDPQGAEHIGLDLVARLRLGEFLDEAELAVAGVVDHHVEAAEMLVSTSNGSDIRGAIGDVEFDRQDRGPVGVDEVGERVEVAGCRGNAIAAIECRDRPFSAEAARGPGDEPDLAAIGVRDLVARLGTAVHGTHRDSPHIVGWKWVVRARLPRRKRTHP